MQRLSIILLSLLFFACQNPISEHTEEEVQIDLPVAEDSGVVIPVEEIEIDEEEIEEEIDEDTTFSCYVADFILLKDAVLQEEFYLSLDSLRNVESTNSSVDSTLFFDLNRATLKKFIEDINTKDFLKTNYFSKEYDFGGADTGNPDSTNCTDFISVTYDDKSCEFTISLQESYFEEDFGCAESSLIYNFKIREGKAVYLLIAFAG